MNNVLKIIFTLSVLLNFFLLGILASYSFSSFHHKPRGPEVLKDSLSPLGQKHLSRVVTKTKQGIKDDFLMVRKIRTEMVEVIKSEEFDEKKYEYLAQELIKLHVKMLNAKMQMHMQLAKDLPDEDRKLLSKRLSNFSISKKRHRPNPDSFQNKQDHPPFAKDQALP
jgi:hypothetical protein